MGTWFEAGRGHRYQFQYKNTTYKSPRGFTTKGDALAAESEHRRRLRLEAAGVIVAPIRRAAASFTNWAGVYSEYVHGLAAKGQCKRPEAIDYNLTMLLRFWGARPTMSDVQHRTGRDPKYLDLTLLDPIADPSLILQWEDWLEREGFAGDTRNHLNTALKQMYLLALRAEYRLEAGDLPYNPFAGRPRWKGRRRKVSLTVEQIQAWMTHASYHVRLAMSIAALAMKFRLKNVLELTWQESEQSHIDLANRRIIVWDHKADANGKVLVAPISDQLLAILEDARRRHPRATHAVWYQRRAVKDIGEGVQAAAEAADIPWGRKTPGGATFHTLRHSMNTFMGQLKVHPVAHQQAAGHEDFETTLSYTHLNVDDQRGPIEQLSAHLPVVSIVTSGVSRISRGARGDSEARGEPRGERNSRSGAKVGVSVRPTRASVGTAAKEEARVK